MATHLAGEKKISGPFEINYIDLNLEMVLSIYKRPSNSRLAFTPYINAWELTTPT